MKNWLKSNWFKIIAIVILLGALGQQPSVYYFVTRWVVSVVAFYLAYKFYLEDKKLPFDLPPIFPLMFTVIGVLFNPILPIFLKKETWQIIDLIVAILFAVIVYADTEERLKPYDQKIPFWPKTPEKTARIKTLGWVALGILVVAFVYWQNRNYTSMCNDLINENQQIVGQLNSLDTNSTGWNDLFNKTENDSPQLIECLYPPDGSNQ